MGATRARVRLAKQYFVADAGSTGEHDLENGLKQ